MDSSKLSRTMLFMRHGETTANVMFIASGGDRDPDLTDRGLKQAVDALDVLKNHAEIPGIIVTSPLKRTSNTAYAISEHFGLEVVFDPDLKERELGDWNGTSSAIVNPMLMQGKTPPNGESRAIFQQRTLKALKRSLELGDLPMVIGSRGTARILLELVDHADPLNFPNGSIMKIMLEDSESFQVSEIMQLQ